MRPVAELNARFTIGTLALGIMRRASNAGLLEGQTAWGLLLQAGDHLRQRANEEGVKWISLATSEGERDGPALLLATDEVGIDKALKGKASLSLRARAD